MTFARRVAVAPIVVYRRVVSPLLPPRCKYAPSCSEYAVQAISEFGILRGLVLAAWRLLRCNPFSHGGFDPVQARTLFRVKPNVIPAERPRRRTRERASERERS